jgi:hypothetical protein
VAFLFVQASIKNPSGKPCFHNAHLPTSLVKLQLPVKFPKEVVLSRIVSAIFALALLIALVVAVDPNARKKAAEVVQNFEPALRKMDDTVVVNVPSVDVDVETAKPTSTPVPTVTPLAPSTDDVDEDSSDEPIIVINWDALGDSLRNFWESLKQVKIDIDPRDNK